MHKDYKFREYYRKKNRNACFRCTVKTCKARIETNDVIAVAEYEDHDHSDIVSNVAAVALRVCKKLVTQQLSQLCIRLQETYTAVKDISQCPSKIIRTALQSIVVTSADYQVTSRDIVNCRAAM